MMKKTLAVVTILAATSATAFAADNGFYVGVDAGTSSIKSTGALTKSTDTVMGISGGYQFNQNWGAEVQYTGLGNYAGVGRTTGTNYTSKIDAWSLSAVGKYPVSESFSLLAKLGVANVNNQQYSVANGGRNTKRTDATYGIGAQYDVNSAIGVRFGWDRFTSDAYVTTTRLTNRSNLDIWSLGALYKF